MRLPAPCTAAGGRRRPRLVGILSAGGRRRLLPFLAGTAAAGALAISLAAPAAAQPVAAEPASSQVALAQAAAVGHAVPAAPGADCKIAPTPELPGRGVVGFFESRPGQLPAPGDPFIPGTTTSVHEQYGYAGLRFNTYDLGCGLDLTNSPDATVGTTISNWVLTLPKTLVAATGALLGSAYEPRFLSVFDPLVSNVVDALRRTVFDQWAAVVLVALGFLIVWRARKASLASTTAAIGWALLVMLIATVLFRWPVEAGQIADRSVTTTLSAVTGGLNGHPTNATSSAGAEATANLHESVLYKAWLGGTFGDANAQVAQRYGPRIFDAQSLTWQQAETLRTDQAQGQRILAAKQQEFKDAAAAVQAEDPDAYEYLVGRRSDTRVGYSVLATIAALCAVPFLIISGLLVIGALVIVRFGVMLFPAFATLGLFPTMRHLITGIANTLAAAVLNALIFGIGSAVMIRAMGVVLDPATGLPAWLNVVLVLLLTIVMWTALSPFRRLTRMVMPGHDPFRDAAGGVGRFGRGMSRFGGRAAAVALGGWVAGRTARDGADGGLTAPDERLAIATAKARPTRAEAGAPAYGGVGHLPPVPADAAPGAPRYAVAALGAGPSAGEGGTPPSAGGAESVPAGTGGGPGTLRGAAPPELRADHRSAGAGARGLGRPDVAELSSGGSRDGWAAERAAAGASGGGRLVPLPSALDPEDLEGEQVYVLYRPARDEDDEDEMIEVPGTGQPRARG